MERRRIAPPETEVERDDPPHWDDDRPSISLQTKMERIVSKVPETWSSNSPGAPSKYDPAYDDLVEMLHMAGANVNAICGIFRISHKCYYHWCVAYPTFGAAVIKGREIADAKIAKSLFHRALGYSHPAVHIHVSSDGTVTKTHYEKHYPPDTSAAIYWLNNRSNGKWRSQQSIEHINPDGMKVDTSRPPNITVNAVSPKKPQP